MADIGNLKINVGLDNSKVVEGTKGINRQMKLVQAEFKNVSAKIKGFGSDSDKLKAKSDFLNKSVQLQAQKVSELKKAYEQSVSESGKLSAKSENLAKQLIDADTKLVRLKGDLNKTNTALTTSQSKWTQLSTKLDTIGGKFSKVGNKMKDVGKTMATRITAPLVGIGVASIKVATDFEAGMSKVKAISGATGEDMKALEKKAKQMGATTKFSAKESADAMSFMGMAGWKAKDMIDGIDGVMNLASASGEDLAMVSDIVTDGLTAFGLSAKDSGQFADVLASTASNANTNVAMMGETFKYVAPVAGSLGYSIEDTSLAIGLMANSGIKASSAGTSLRQTMLGLGQGAELSGKAFGKWQIDTVNADGTMREFGDVIGDLREAFANMTEAEKASNAEAIAGKTGMSGLLAIVNASEKDYNKLSKAIDNSSGSAKKMADEMNNNLQGQLTIIKSSLEAVGLVIAETLTPYVKQLATFMQGLLDKFNALSPRIQDIIVKVGLVVGAIAPLLLVIGTLATVVGSAMTGLTALGGVLAGISLPIVALVAGVGALIGTMVHLYNTNDVVREKLNQLGEFLKTNFIEAFNQVKNKVTEFFTIFGQKVQSFMANNKPFFDNLIVILIKIGETLASVVQNIVAPMLQTMGDLFGSTLKRVWDVVSTTLQSVYKVFVDVVGLISSLIQGDWSQAWEYAKKIVVDIFTGLIETAFTWGSNLVGMLADGVKASYHVIEDAVKGVGTTIADFLGFHSPTKKGACSDSDKWAGNFMGMFANGINANKSLVMSATQSVANGVKSAFDSAMSYAQSMASRISSLKSSISGSFSSSGGGGGSSSRSSRRESTSEWARNNKGEIERIKRELGVDHIDIQEARDRSESSSRSSSRSSSKSKSRGSSISRTISKAVSSIRNKFKFHTGGFVSPKANEMNATLKMGEFVLSRGHIDFMNKNSGKGNGGSAIDYNKLAKVINQSSRPIEQHITINAPTALNPSEIARRNKLELQRLAMGL